MMKQKSKRHTHIPHSPLLMILLNSLVLLFFIPFSYGGTEKSDNAPKSKQSLHEIVEDFKRPHPGESGCYVFELGEEALLARGWLADHAQHTIDVQYFIWSNDNIGILAAESLLRAANRGVKVRVLVDDLLIDAPDRFMVAVNAHPNIAIRIYNPKHSVGITTIERLFNIASQFRSVNQRMHDKTFTVDSSVTITGGRNMADEYFDYNKSYNFRDRDILLLGPVVETVQNNFNAFWNSELAIPIEEQLKLLDSRISEGEKEKIYAELHAYAESDENVEPMVRKAMEKLDEKIPLLKKKMTWGKIDFIHDAPGKNDSWFLSGGGESTSKLVEAISQAKESIFIQSPYLVFPEGGINYFAELIQSGVEIKISTNSLASTDNLQAFSGYRKQRSDILQAGIQVYEYKPNPAIQQDLIERYEKLKKEAPTFAIHAKTMVIDHELVYIGTFNLDPRSVNLNTEVGAVIRSPSLAKQIEQTILNDMLPANSWNATTDNPDGEASFFKRLKVSFWALLPLTPLL